MIIDHWTLDIRDSESCATFAKRVSGVNAVCVGVSRVRDDNQQARESAIFRASARARTSL